MEVRDLTGSAGRIAAIAALTLGALTAHAPAQTDGAEFLSAYAGEWRGSGETRPDPRSEPTRVTCRVSAIFDENAGALRNKGRCGTTRGTRDLNGTLRLDGANLTGDFLGQAAASGLVNPRARIDQNMIVSEAEVPDGAKMVRVRTFLTHPEDGSFRVQSQYFDRDANQWIVAGELEFTRQ